MPESVVLLHGFSGTHHAFDGVISSLDRERYRPLALDLPGHGALHAQRPIDFDSCVASVLDRAPASFALCGYSMGGRIALHVALAAPDRVTRLALVSSSAGIEDAAERARRREADDELARSLEREPLEAFIERWRTQPLFAGDPPGVDALARADQRRNRTDALAAVLRGVGTGQMQPLWARLGELTMPVVAVAGERDQRYAAIAARIAALAPDGRVEIVAGGHNLLLENPDGVAAALSARDRASDRG
ncbi:MAG TPA: alpha/beta fold hydrolase [Solirubrobacteraceae bacterium]|nr:alpha/beta fold hydrolase [Solirubrobacteraceae bacterium]